MGHYNASRPSVLALVALRSSQCNGCLTPPSATKAWCVHESPDMAVVRRLGP